MKVANSVEDYIALFPQEVKSLLHQMRTLVRETAPDAVESISYGMPAYKYNKKPLVYFGGFVNHIGFYATPNTHEQFASELTNYKRGKGSVQFPLDKPLPTSLIKAMIKFRVKTLKSRK